MNGDERGNVRVIARTNTEQLQTAESQRTKHILSFSFGITVPKFAIDIKIKHSLIYIFKKVD